MHCTLSSAVGKLAAKVTVITCPFVKVGPITIAFTSGGPFRAPQFVGFATETVIQDGHVGPWGGCVATNVQPVGRIIRSSPVWPPVVIVAEMVIADAFVPVVPMVVDDVAVTFVSGTAA